jgi:hypothetical protein
MKTVRGLSVVAVALLTAAMGPALVGQTEKPTTVVQQDSGQQEKHQAEMAVMLQSNNEPLEGQEAQQRVTLEVVAADAQVVKGKPYSADTSTETVQTLADGNRIVHRTVSKFYRDSDGRTRREQTFGNVDPENPTPHEVKVFVDDPVNGAAYVLDPGSKSGDKVQRSPKFLDERNGEFLDERSAKDEAKRSMITLDNGGDEGVQNAPGRMMIKFRDEHSGNPNTVIVPDEKRDVVKEDLGTRNIEGVDCTGTRQTITIPASAVGNEKPIAIVTETWFAPAIAAVVESTTDDPRYGKTSYQLSNVLLNEPARSLFEPPASFKLDVRK